MTGNVIPFPRGGHRGTALGDLMREATTMTGDGNTSDWNCDLDIIRSLDEKDAALYLAYRLAYALERLVNHPYSEGARRDAQVALQVAREFDAMRDAS